MLLMNSRVAVQRRVSHKMGVMPRNFLILLDVLGPNFRVRLLVHGEGNGQFKFLIGRVGGTLTVILRRGVWNKSKLNVSGLKLNANGWNSNIRELKLNDNGSSAQWSHLAFRVPT